LPASGLGELLKLTSLHGGILPVVCRANSSIDSDSHSHTPGSYQLRDSPLFLPFRFRLAPSASAIVAPENLEMSERMWLILPS
jgi:hypothetical protein